MVNKIQITDSLEDRLDTYLQKQLPLSRQKIQQHIKNGAIRLNDKLVKPSHKVQDNDLVYVDLPQEQVIDYPSIKIDVLYEDKELLVINKPVDCIVQKSDTSDEPSVIDHLKAQGVKFKDVKNPERDGIVHRLDRMTEGVLVIAKTKAAHDNLSAQFKERRIIKKYYALLKGNVLNDEVDINQPIARNPKNRHRFLVLKGGKDAESFVKVIKRFNSMTLTEWQIKTGRTHQIRVHAKFFGHPVIDDVIYGTKSKGLGQRLQAYLLEFEHPKTKKTMSFELDLSERLKL